LVDPEVSIVIPLRDEEENVVPLHDELTGVFAQIGVSYEMILVDDGSVDGTFQRLAEVQARDPLVFVAVPVVLTAVAFVAVWLPARRASRIDPIIALRAE